MTNRIIFCIVSCVMLSGALTGCNSNVIGPPITTSENNLNYGNAVGNRAYDFSLPDLNDKFINLSSLQGHPVVLNFWSTT